MIFAMGARPRSISPNGLNSLQPLTFMYVDPSI
jgi:hypothetical protein